MQPPFRSRVRTLFRRLPSALAGTAPALVAIVFIGIGSAQNFIQPALVPSFYGGWPTAVYTADFNEDGIPDLLYIDHAPNGSAVLHVLINNGKGSFTETFSAADPFTSLAVGDLLGNGHADIGYVLGEGSGSGNGNIVRIIAGLGDGTFGANHQAVIPTAANTVKDVFSFSAALRLTSSGPLTLVAQDATANTLFTFQANATPPNSGSGPNGFPNGYTTQTSVNLPDGAGPAFAADLNKDGFPELIVNGQTTYTTDIFTGSALGIPTSAVPSARFTGLTGIHSLILQDLTGDGIPDLIAEGADGHLDVFPGLGNGTFSSSSIGGTGPLDGLTGNGGHLIVATDLNHDGKLDALTATPAGISALLGNGSQYLGLKGIYNAGPGRASYATADFNRDGILDLAVDSPEGIAILYGNADGSFQTNQAFASQKPALASAAGIFTSSGNTDFVVATATTQGQFLHGNGDGTFTPAPSFTSAQPGDPTLFSTVQAGDFNGDGNLDLAFTATGAPLPINAQTGLLNPGAPTGLQIQYGSGNGTFLPPVALPQPATANSLYGYSAVADLNGDGVSDIISLDSFYYDTLLGIRGGAPGAFTTGLNFLEDGTYANNAELDPFSTVATGFFKTGRTSKPDLVFQDDAVITPWLNSGDGIHFTVLSPLANTPAITQFYGGQIIVADIDGDGNADIILPYFNVAGATPAHPSAAYPNKLYIWYGQGNGQFSTPAITTLSRNFYLGALTDVDGDGLPDLILSDGYVVSILYNLGNRQFGHEVHLLAGQGINQITLADVDNDGNLDLVATNGGASISYPVAIGGLSAPVITLPANPDVNNGGITVLINNIKATGVRGSLVASPEPSAYSAPFTITANVAPVSSALIPTGTVDFSIDGLGAGSAPLVNGVAALAVPSVRYATLTPGLHALSGFYSGDNNFSPSSALIGTHTVSLIPTSLSLLLCVDPPGSNFPCGNPIQATPLISPISMYFGQSVDGVTIESATDLTGTITFFNGSSVFCVLNASLQQGSNICPVNSGIFPAGTATVTTVYSGDSTHQPSTSNGIVVQVLQDLTTATLTSSLNPATFGQTVSFDAFLQGNFAVPNGSVIFLDGNIPLATVPLNSAGHAFFSTSTLAVGTHPITVAYPGSADFASVTSTTTFQVILAPVVPLASTVSLLSSLNPSAVTQSVTFTATVSVPGATPLPAGTVTFLDGASVLASIPINSSGVASFTSSTLAVGLHPIVALFGGAPGSPGFGPLPPPVVPRPPVTHLTPRAPLGAGMRLSGPVPHATVAHPPPPSMFVPLSQPQTPSATAPRPAPRATPVVAPVLPSTSNVVTQVVTSPVVAQGTGFTLSVTPSPISVGVGQTAALLVTVHAASSATPAVQLSCIGLPAETACSFVQPVLSPGGGSTTLQLHVSAPHDCNSTTPYFIADAGGSTPGPAASSPLGALAIPGLLGSGVLLAGLRRRRHPRLRALLILILGLSGIAALSGCGNCTDLGTRPGNYSFQVVGTALSSSNPEVEAQKIPMTVTLQ